MGINIAAEKDYTRAIRVLFPRGEYWEKQFADPESDVNLFCTAKTQKILHLRKRMRDMLGESNYKTALETIDDWERVLLGFTNSQLPLEERRKLLDRETPVVNKLFITGIAARHGLNLVDIVFPFKPSFFGFSQFGVSLFSRPAFYSVFFIIAELRDSALKEDAAGWTAGLLNNTSFGRACFGSGEFLGRSFFNRHFTSRVFGEREALADFEREVNGKLLSSNIAYFQYKL